MYISGYSISVASSVIYIYMTEEATEMAAKYLQNKKMCF